MNKVWNKIVKRENNKVDWKKAEENIGMEVAGYRYGSMHPRGYSVNHATGVAEPGHSMASVMGLEEVGSFASLSEGRKRVYVIGEVAGIGSDDEVCLKNARVVSCAEYKEFLKNNKEKKEKIKQNLKMEVKSIKLEIATRTECAEHLILGISVYNKEGKYKGSRWDYVDENGNCA